MVANDKRVTYFEFVQSPVFLDMLGAEPGVSIARIDRKDGEPVCFETLGRAHVYQTTSARDDLPPAYRVDAALLARCPELLVVSTNGAGFDTVDVDACTAAGVAAVNQSGGNKEGVAEHALAMMLSLSKRVVESDRLIRRQAGVQRRDLIGNDILGKTVGIVGIGNIGGRVADLVRGLFQCRVLAYDPYVDAAEVRRRGAEKVEDLETLLRASDFVTVHCPLTRDTRGMFDAAAFAAMKPEAYFVITARGSIVDEAALAEALREKRIRGAGLDVFEVEPPPLDNPLLALDNVIVSPHTAGVTVESRENIAKFAAEQLIGVFKGERPPRLLNPEVWPHFRERFAATWGFAPAE